MNRRGFLGLLGGVTVVALIGELPSSKTFFLPPAGGWRRSDFKKPWWHSTPHGELVGFGLAPTKPEGGIISYDHDIFEERIRTETVGKPAVARMDEMVFVKSRIHSADTLAFASKYRVIREDIEDLTDWPRLRLPA
jgi:hypothetical protein